MVQPLIHYHYLKKFGIIVPAGGQLLKSVLCCEFGNEERS